MRSIMFVAGALFMTACGASKQPAANASSPPEPKAPSAGASMMAEYAEPQSAPPSQLDRPGPPGQPAGASTEKPSSPPPTREEIDSEFERQRVYTLQLRGKSCIEACRALQALERTVSRLCSVEPARCPSVTEVAKRTHAQVVESCPSCTAAAP